MIKPMVELEKTLAGKLDAEFRRTGITDVEIADLCEVSPQAVGKWRKNGKIKLKHLVLVAERFGRKVDFFLVPGEEPEDIGNLQSAIDFVDEAMADMPWVDNRAKSKLVSIIMDMLKPDGSLDFGKAAHLVVNEAYQAPIKPTKKTTKRRKAG